MKRSISLVVALALLAGCSSSRSGSSPFLPGASGSVPVTGAQRAKVDVHLTIRIPRRHHKVRAGFEHPSTISSLTQSVTVQVGSATSQVFDATPSSPGCTIGSTGTTCRFVVKAPPGSDTFVVRTFASPGGGGTLLDQGSAVVKIVAGTANAPSITLGPVVSTSADAGAGSLRFAIGSANTGDTVIFLAGITSITLTSNPITISNRVSVAGPGASVLGISGGGARQIFWINAGGTLILSGATLTQGVANQTDKPGGAIYNLGAVELARDILKNNTSEIASPLIVRAHARKRDGTPPQRQRHPNCTNTTYDGGAVYNQGTLDIAGSTFENNIAASDASTCVTGRGGAVFNDVNGVITSEGNTYESNSAMSGGAVYNTSQYGSATFTGDTFDANFTCTAISGCPTTGCTTSCTTVAHGDGGAIYDEEGPGVQIASSTFEHNYAGGPSGGSNGDGGALYLNGTAPSVNGSTFTDNLAGGGTSNCSYGEGGAIFIDNATMQPMANDTFTSNVAGGDQQGTGGAIYETSPIQGTNDTFATNKALGLGSACSASGEAQGGAIYAQSPLAFAGSRFTENEAASSAQAYGGALYSTDRTTLSSDTFTSNEAQGSGSTGQGTESEGGAIFAAGYLIMSGTFFTSNVAASLGTQGEIAQGGAIYDVAQTTSLGDVFTSNEIKATGTNPQVYGGAVYVQDPFSSTRDTYKSNTATGPQDVYGGALYSANTTVISGATFSSNSTNGGVSFGGALNSEDNETTITNSTFTGNSANSPSGQEGRGGGIYDGDGFTISGTTVLENSASQAGGGIYTQGDELVSNCTISGNKVLAAAHLLGGGGIFSQNGITIYNSTISGNSVTVTGQNAGGAGLMSIGPLELNGSTVAGNSVVGNISNSGGAGVFSQASTTISNSTIVGNRSSIDGGGFEQYENATVNLVNDTIYKNTAAGAGGNIDNPYAITIGNTIVAGGAAASGADISNTGTMTSSDYNIIQTTVVGNALTGATTHDLQKDPLLLGLTNNGGPTFTDADTSTSPGKGYIPFAATNCGTAGTDLTVDQRGFARGAGGKCDVGAYEFAGVASAIRSHGAPIRARARKAKHQ
jgi:hypothetical protein